MPGPSNSNVKRKRKSRGKDNKSQKILPVFAQSQLSQESTAQAQEPPTDYKSNLPSLPSLDDHVPGTVEEVMLKQPFIYDPGNGPRVRIAKEFISSFFAQPPAFDVSSALVLLFIYFEKINVTVHWQIIGSTMRRICTRRSPADALYNIARRNCISE
jgi:hypothetical protein